MENFFFQVALCWLWTNWPTQIFDVWWFTWVHTTLVLGPLTNTDLCYTSTMLEYTTNVCWCYYLPVLFSTSQRNLFIKVLLNSRLYMVSIVVSYCLSMTTVGKCWSVLLHSHSVCSLIWTFLFSLAFSVLAAMVEASVTVVEFSWALFAVEPTCANVAVDSVLFFRYSCMFGRGPASETALRLAASSADDKCLGNGSEASDACLSLNVELLLFLSVRNVRWGWTGHNAERYLPLIWLDTVTRSPWSSSSSSSSSE